MNDDDEPNQGEAAPHPDSLRMGSALIEIVRPLGGVDLGIARDRTPVIPFGFD